MHGIFHELVGGRIANHIQVEYCFQELTDIPAGCTLPQGREKPFGTAHAVLAARHLIKGPFAVINADDYYGKAAFKLIYKYLSEDHPPCPEAFAMVGYRLANTLTENGYVSRGVCEVGETGTLLSVTERTRIEKLASGPAFTEDEGETYTPLAEDTIVSMNMFGLQAGFMAAAQEQFAEFFAEKLPQNPTKAEFYLPSVVSRMVAQGAAAVQVLPTPDRWYGVTYKEDRETVAKALRDMERAGVYPAHMLGL